MKTFKTTLLPPKKPSEKADTQTGIDVCVYLYEKISPLGFYPALTGGALYKEGERKDLDIVIFRNRQSPEFEFDDLIPTLKRIGFSEFKNTGFVCKCVYKNINIDLFNPETDNGNEYGQGE